MTGRPKAARAFVVLAWLAVAGVAVQVYLAGYALLADPAAWAWHRGFVHAVELVPIAMVLIAWLGKGPLFLLWLSLALFGLIWLQYVLINVPVGVVQALHPVNALAIVVVAFLAARAGTGRWLRGEGVLDRPGRA